MNDLDRINADETTITTQKDGTIATTLRMDLTHADQTLIADRYLTKLFLWIALWAVLTIAFIWMIDPYGVSPLQISLPGINTQKPKRLDIDRLIKPYEVWRYQPKTVFLGTSRIHQSIDPSVFNGTDFAPAYNAAIPASTLAENAAHIEQYLKLDPKIKHIFIELFLYNFIQGQVPSPAKTWSEFLSNYVSLQISTDALFDAIQTIFTNRQRDPIAAHIAKLGYRIPSSDFNPATTFSDVTFINTVLSWDRAAKMSLQPSAFESLDRIVALARRHGVQLHLLMTPNYPWDDYRLITLGYWPLLEEWMRKMATYSDVVSFSQYNELLEEPPTLSPKMKWWNDPIHFSLNMGRIIMNSYLGHPVEGTPINFMRQVTPATVESVIAERHRGALRWSATHPDFVADFEDAKTISDSVSGTLNAPAKILTVNGHNHPIVLGIGEVVFVVEQGSSLVANAWSADEIAKQHVKQVIATIGSAVVAQGFATVKKKDIELALGKSFSCGVALEIPLKTWDGSEPIRVFAIMRDGRAVQLTSQTPLIDGVPVVSSLGKAETNKLVIGGKTYPIVNCIAGSVEGATPIPNGYGVNGWVADIKANGPAIAIVAAVGSNVVAKGLPTINRDDITKHLTIGASPAGFTMNVPLRSDQKNSSSQVQLFALMADGAASPLASNLADSTGGIFKNVQMPKQ